MINFKNKLLISFCTVGLLSLNLFGNEIENSAQEVNEAVVLEEKLSSSDMLEAKFENYINNYNNKRISKNKSMVSYGQAFDNGKILLTAYARIPGNPNSSQWAKQRSMAYTTAYLNAMEKFSLYQNTNIITDIGRQVFSDDSSDAGKIPEDKLGDMAVIWEKIKSLAGAQLDKALADAGVDIEQFKTSDAKKKKTMFFQSITQKTITSTSSRVRGFLPIKTYEGKGEDGTYGIGIVCMYSHKLQQIAIDITNRKSPFITKKGGISPIEYINKLSKKELLNSFGTRLIFDQNGEPAIISFGQWSHSYTGKSASKKERMRMIAKKSARSSANANIAMLLKGTMSSKEEVENSMQEEEYMEQIGDGLPIEKIDEKIVDILKSEAQASAKVSVSGTGSIKSWRAKHENGQEIVGTIQVLTFSGMRGAQKTRNFKAERAKTQNKAKSSHKTINTNGRVDDGAGMSVDDF